MLHHWTPNLLAFIEEVLHGKLHFLCFVSEIGALCPSKLLKLVKSPISGVKTDLPVKSLPKKVLSFKITRKVHARTPKNLRAQVCGPVYTHAPYLLK